MKVYCVGTIPFDQHMVRKAIREFEKAAEEIGMPPADEIDRYHKAMKCRHDAIALLSEVQLKEFDTKKRRT